MGSTRLAPTLQVSGESDEHQVQACSEEIAQVTGMRSAVVRAQGHCKAWQALVHQEQVSKVKGQQWYPQACA